MNYEHRKREVCVSKKVTPSLGLKEREQEQEHRKREKAFYSPQIGFVFNVFLEQVHCTVHQVLKREIIMFTIRAKCV